MQTTVNNTSTHYILSIVIAILLSLFGKAFMASNQAHAASNNDDDVRVIKIETEINSTSDSSSGEESRIEVKVSDDNDGVRSFTFDRNVLNDLAQLEFELSELDIETQQTVINVLEQVKENNFHMDFDETSEELQKIFVMKNEQIHATEKALEELEHFTAHKGDILKFIRSSSSKSIAKMIEKGEFNQEQLDEIQRALDSKR